jgi:predicted secreted protein
MGPPSYFWQSIISLFLFLPTGLAAVYFSLQVGRRVEAGDQAGAVRTSRLARAFCQLSLVVAIVALLYLLAMRGNTGG